MACNVNRRIPYNSIKAYLSQQYVDIVLWSKLCRLTVGDKTYNAMQWWFKDGQISVPQKPDESNNLNMIFVENDELIIK